MTGPAGRLACCGTWSSEQSVLNYTIWSLWHKRRGLCSST